MADTTDKTESKAPTTKRIGVHPKASRFANGYRSPELRVPGLDKDGETVFVDLAAAQAEALNRKFPDEFIVRK